MLNGHLNPQTPSPEYFMKEALRQAQKALDEDEVPIGVVIVHKNRLIAKAYNQVNLLKDPTAHAEMLAITQAAEFFKHDRILDAELYVTLEPCLMCVGAMIHARITKVYFGAKNPKFGALGSVINAIQGARWNHTLGVQGGILEEDAGSLLQEFFRSKRGKGDI